MLHTLAIGMPGGFEWIIILGIGLMLFGKRLPEVGRSLGKGIVEFKKGLKGVEDEVAQVDEDIDRQKAQQPAKPLLTAQPQYKFDPETGKPLVTEQPRYKFDPETGKPLTADALPAGDAHATAHTEVSHQT